MAEGELGENLWTLNNPHNPTVEITVMNDNLDSETVLMIADFDRKKIKQCPHCRSPQGAHFDLCYSCGTSVEFAGSGRSVECMIRELSQLNSKLADFDSMLLRSGVELAAMRAAFISSLIREGYAPDVAQEEVEYRFQTRLDETKQ